MFDFETGFVKAGCLVAQPVGAFAIFLDDNSIDDCWFTLAWGK